MMTGHLDRPSTIPGDWSLHRCRISKRDALWICGTSRSAFHLIAERINERLKGAMAPELPIAEPVAASGVNAPAEALPPLPSDSAVTTSPEEQEGFLTIRAILRSIIPSKRVTMRDAQTYCAILLDDNNRRPICRLRFNNPDRLRVGLFGPNREETIIAIDSVDDLFLHAEAIIQDILKK